jgi:hypothetical protein
MRHMLHNFFDLFVDKNDSLKNTEGQKNLIIYLVGFFAFG